MARYIDGDEAAFRRLFAKLAPRLHAFFRRSFGQDVVADDLLQTTFLKLHGARGSYERGQRVTPWIYGIAARVRADELRRRYRRRDDASVDDVVLGVSGDEAESNEISTVVRAAVDMLPEGQRVVVHLHRFDDMTFREIGEVLGLEEGTVRVRAFRAYATLRERLAEMAPTTDAPPEVAS